MPTVLLLKNCLSAYYKETKLGFSLQDKLRCVLTISIVLYQKKPTREIQRQAKLRRWARLTQPGSRGCQQQRFWEGTRQHLNSQEHTSTHVCWNRNNEHVSLNLSHI